MQKNKDYSLLAQFYSHLMRKIEYDKWSEYLASFIDECFDENANILEVGGGNGSLANYLSQSYKNYLLTDLSFQMLRESKSNSLPKVACDMVFIPFKKKFDVIICAFDSINYILSKKKLEKFFKEIYNSLEENGILLFDASLEKNSILHSSKKYRTAKFNNSEYTQSSKYDEKKRIHYNRFVIKTSDGKIFNEVHKQRIYFLSEYFYYIEKSGLYVAECYDNFGNRTGKETSPRVQFVVKKGFNYA